MSNIFDLTITNDLPPELQKTINRKTNRPITGIIIDLFNIKSRLSLNEILVGLYRKHNILHPKGWLANHIYNLKKRNILVRNEDGTYSRVS